ncbi:MAG: uracil phosphoribosyltransferase [Acidobacteria bacterium]|nr:uracil phosphoribosyltransferase [Acidobacteriota bacterium]
MAVFEIDHPLIRHKLGYLRNEKTHTPLFRQISGEMAALLAYEACHDLETERTTVESWAGEVEVDRLDGEHVTLAAVLRAGLGMLEGVLHQIPTASVSFLGMERNEETLEPHAYYEKMAPHTEGSTVLLIDPMLATGGTAVASIEFLARDRPARIKALFLIAAPEGIAKLEEAHPEVDIYTAVVDSHLNEFGYILPGLGDAGDRIFGT